LLGGEPGGAILSHQCDRFVGRIHAMRHREINIAGELAAFDEHRAATVLD
jgi:hypothetical protein